MTLDIDHIGTASPRGAHSNADRGCISARIVDRTRDTGTVSRRYGYSCDA